jgi:general secretion pathway protein G
MKKNFTLIELIVVIAIVAVLAAIIAPNAFRAIEKAKVSRAVADMKAIKNAAYAFYADTGTIPCTKAGGWGKDPGFVTPITAANCWPTEGGCDAGCTDIPGWAGPYIDKWPFCSPWCKMHRDPAIPILVGKYDWGRRPSYGPRATGISCGLAGVVSLEVYGAVPVSSLKKIDEVLDDGNLDTGNVFTETVSTGGLGDPVDPDYLQYIATCQ